MNSSDRDETVLLHRVYRTIHQMLRDRGYSVPEAALSISLSDFTSTFASAGIVADRSALNLTISHALNGERLFVFFPEDLSLGIKPIRQYLEKMNEQGVYRAIIVYKGTLTPSASKVMQSMAPKYLLEAFSQDQLVVNITEHVLVPQHIPIGDEEKKALLQKYHLKETQLPKILLSDPVARYYGLRRGQVVKIIRNSETAGRYVTYRIAA